MEQFQIDCDSLDLDWADFSGQTLGDAYRAIEKMNPAIVVFWACVDDTMEVTD